ncbi:MAG: hypothetical protein R6U32_01295 [Candidatus Woesearchaeota archaeon]
MSNICACISDRAAAIISDSLSYSEKTGEKNERTQKIFSINNSLVSGVGDSDYVLGYISLLQQANWGKKSGPKDLADRLVDELIRREGEDNPVKEDFTIYIAGLEGRKPRLYEFKSKTKISTEIMPGPDNFSLAGSGEDLMQEAIQRDRNRGMTPEPKAELTELIDFAYNSTMAAQENVHVNAELQYGLISSEAKEGRALYDPQVILKSPPPNYLEKDGSVNTGKKGRKGINDDVYKVLGAYMDLRQALKHEFHTSIHRMWNNIKPEKDPERMISTFHELEGMTRDFLGEYLRCDYRNHRAWIEDEAKDIVRFAKKVFDSRDYQGDRAVAREAVAALPETKAKEKYMAGLK